MKSVLRARRNSVHIDLCVSKVVIAQRRLRLAFVAQHAQLSALTDHARLPSAPTVSFGRGAFRRCRWWRRNRCGLLSKTLSHQNLLTVLCLLTVCIIEVTMGPGMVLA